MDFDSEGNLYIATGDNTNHSQFATLNETNPNESSENTSSNTNDLRGKILRIKPLPNGSYAIPEGNLFPNGEGGLPEIYVMGARNPFKIFVDKTNTDWLFWGEVGPDANKSSAMGPKGMDEINLTKKSGNYGWPYFSGKNEPYLNTYTDPNFYYDPNNPLNLSVWNTGAEILPPAEPSWLEFFHDCYLVGPRYYFDPTISNSKKLPAEFDEGLFFYDFNKSKVWLAKLDEQGNHLSTTQLAPSVVTGTGFIDLKIGADGQLYILEYGVGCCPDNTGSGKLVRLDYIGAGGNSSPEITMKADVSSGSLPLAVNFSSEGTFDIDGYALDYEWDFQSDGIVDSHLPHPTFTFHTQGIFSVRLKVTDSQGAYTSKSLQIHAGNNAATFEFIHPPDGGMSKNEDVAYLAVKFENNFMGHFHVNWLSPVKLRKTLVAGDKKMLVWDDLEQEDKVKIYDKGVDIVKQNSHYKLYKEGEEMKDKSEIYDFLVKYRSGDMYGPKIEHTEALKLETQHLVDCINYKHKPINDGIEGLKVVQILEASDISLKNNGREIALSSLYQEI